MFNLRKEGYSYRQNYFTDKRLMTRVHIKPSGIVTLTSDFGTSDGYVGAMKGKMLGLAPMLKLVDVAHDIPPQDIESGAAVIGSASSTFPRGTVHLVVVDPGVGTARAPIVVQARKQFFVGPDNGVLSSILLSDVCQARVINLGGRLGPILGTPKSATFHGRDIFAPVAALLASGMVRFQDVGPRVDPIVCDRPVVMIQSQFVLGKVVSIDRFGNCITNVNPDNLDVMLDRHDGVAVDDDVVLPWLRTYGEVERGTGLALVGSEGFLEIAVRDGSAAKMFGISRGHIVRLRRDSNLGKI